MKKSQLARIVELDRQIREKEYPNCNSFSRDYGISTRTVARDIQYLINLDAPLKYNETRKGYYYEDNEWSLPDIYFISASAEDEISFILKRLENLSSSTRNTLFTHLTQKYSDHFHQNTQFVF